MDHKIKRAMGKRERGTGKGGGKGEGRGKGERKTEMKDEKERAKCMGQKV